MIGLNKIGLNQVQLNQLYLNTLCTGQKSSGGDGFPRLPGDVTRWSFKGLTNEMMAKNPRLEDADHKGRFLTFKNFAWRKMSGVGGYSEDFSQYGYGNIKSSTYEYTRDKIILNIPSSSTTPSPNLDNIYSNAGKVGSVGDVYDFTIKITGLKSKGKILVSGGVRDEILLETAENGVYHIKTEAKESWTQFRIYFWFYYGKESMTVEIEQLPYYPGFIIGDGVDDYAVTEKNLDFEDTYTVYTAFIPFETPIKYPVLCGKDYKKDFYINYIGDTLRIASFYSSNKSVYIPILNGFNILCCKRTLDKIVIKNLITGMSSEVSVDALIDNPGLYYLWVGLVVKGYAKAAIAGQIIDNGHFTTDEEDTKVLNWYKKDYPWLFFDQAWTVTGKTNEDTDRATIANITGNGNNLVLSNFGFAEGSGYNEQGEYAGYLVTDGVDDKIASSNFEMGKDFTVVGEWKLLPVSSYSYAGIIKSNNLYVYNNASTGITVYICASGIRNDMEGLKSLKAICSDGRVYGEDWTEYKLNVGSYTGLLYRLFLGYNDTKYTQIAFKNLGIYNNQILSKDDCIKAYNYLQTLKAK